MFEDPEFREVFRSLDVNFYLKRVEPDPAHPTTPVLYFFGEMQAPSTSTMPGRVRMSVDNQIQWHFVGCILKVLKKCLNWVFFLVQVSGDQGDAIWNCEGVQVGGLGSSFGVLGSWTTIFHDIDDPVGKQLHHYRFFKMCYHLSTNSDWQVSSLKIGPFWLRKYESENILENWLLLYTNTLWPLISVFISLFGRVVANHAPCTMIMISKAHWHPWRSGLMQTSWRGLPVIRDVRLSINHQ